MALFHVVVARIRAAFRSSKLDSDFDQELEAHLDMAEADKMRSGMTREQARRAARIELGGLTQLREAGRSARGLPWLDPFWLDIKLGLRMLRKSWGLTIVGGLAMTVVIFIAGFAFQMLHTLQGEKLPLDEGDRIVAMAAWDPVANEQRGILEQDFERWRTTLRSVEDVGAFRTVERSLVTDDGPAEPVAVAEMTASGFQMARVPPLLGRPLIEEDEQDGAIPVVVIGHQFWHSRFLSDPAIVGQRVSLGGIVHTVVGVMPEEFGFPVNHGIWTPLRVVAVQGQGTQVLAFGRLAPGASLEVAQAELSTLGLLPSSADPPAELQLQPRVMPYTYAFTGDLQSGQGRWTVRFVLFFVSLLLIPPCAKIAILVYARTVTRQEEFAARTALGATRRRIVAQVFIEVLVLAGAAAGVALILAQVTVTYLRGAVSLSGDSFAASGGAPFWMDFSLSFSTVVFAAGLAVFAAVIAGVLPALKATGSQMQQVLRVLGGGRTGTQLGATWTALVVAQVALSVAALPLAAEMGWGTIRNGILGPGFAADQYMTARIAMDGEQFSPDSRFSVLQAELVRQLEAEPEVLDVTMVSALPGDEPWAHVEVSGVPLADEGIFASNNLVRFSRVDDAFLDTFDIPVLIGRKFEASDFASESAAVIVNLTFAQQLLGDENPLGHRVRYLGAIDAEPGGGPERWYEIVGVVSDRPANATHGTMYHPSVPTQLHSVYLAVRVRPFDSLRSLRAGRLREIAMALDSTLVVNELHTLDEIYHEKQVGNNLGALGLAVVTLSVLLLSAAGMYALMSFTVNQRRREIGIRSALGAQPRRLLAGIFRRALRQLGVGAIAGLLVAIVLDFYVPIELVGGWNIPAVIPAAAALMITIGLLSAFGPARRGLKVEPTEALRDG